MSKRHFTNGRGQRGRDKLSAKDKVLSKMTKDGLVEQNVTTGNQKRVSKRNTSLNLRDQGLDGDSNDLFLGAGVEEVTPTKRQMTRAMDAPIQSTSGTDTLSQVGTSSDSAKRSREEQLTSKRTSSATTRDSVTGSKTSPSENSDVIVQFLTAQLQAPVHDIPHGVTSSTIQSQAKIYQFPLPNETEQESDDTATTQISPNKLQLSPSETPTPRTKLSHKSKLPTGLGTNQVSNLRQSSKRTNLSLVPPLDTSREKQEVSEVAEPSATTESDQSKVSPKRKQIKPTIADPTADNSDPTVKPTSSKLQFADNETPSTTTGNQHQQPSSNANGLHPPRSPTDSLTPQRTSRAKGGREEQRSGAHGSSNGAGSNTNNSRHGHRQSDKSSQSTSDQEPMPSIKTSKLTHSVEKTSGKLDNARANLPTKPKVRLERTLDEVTNKGKTRLRLDKQVKSQRDHLKGPIPLRPLKFATNTAIAKAHVKIYQVEDENVGTKAAHKVELAGERVIRSALRHRKRAPYKRVARLERKLSNQSAKLSYRQALDNNPKLRRNSVARAWQKRQIKRRHMKTLKQARKGLAQSRKTGSFITRTTKTLAMVIKKNPKVWIALVAVFVVINILSSLIGALAGLSSSGMGAILTTTYLSEEAEIETVSLTYNRWEMELTQAILTVESSHLGFDEYRFNTGQINHNPFELMAYLTATHHIFTMSEVEGHLRDLFDEQYQLSFDPSIEIRYRDSGEVNGDGNPIYEPFEWHIMTVTLIALSFTDVVTSRMTPDQRLHFDLLMQSRGQRPLVGSPFDFDWHHLITSPYGYRIHPITGVIDLHRGIDIGLPTGTPILSGLDGTVTFAGVMGGYGNVVIIHGDQGLEARYAHMDTMSVSSGQSISLGDTIGTVGSTGLSTGPHLHMEVLRNGQFLNPIFFVALNPSN